MSNELSLVLQDFVMNLVQAVLTIAAPVIVGLAVRYGLLLVEQVKGRLSSDQLFLLENLGALVVKAAEQAGLNGVIQNIAEEKKAYAIAELQRLLAERGITRIDVATLSLIIEAAVRDGVHIREPLILATAPAPLVDPYGDTKKFL